MWFRLALAMGSTVAEIQRRMSSSEFSEWAAFDRIEPIGFNGFNYHFSTLSATVANAMGGKKSGGQFTPMDFAYISNTERERSERQEREAIIQRLKNWNKSIGDNIESDC